jgi:hypothetical protein
VDKLTSGQERIFDQQTIPAFRGRYALAYPECKCLSSKRKTDLSTETPGTPCLLFFKYIKHVYTQKKKAPDEGRRFRQ